MQNINNDVSLTPNDYRIMKDFIDVLHDNIENQKTLQILMDKLNPLSIWQKADMTCSEELFGNPIIQDNTMLCIRDNKYHLFQIVHRFARKGDLLYIVNDERIGDGYKGKYFRVFDRVSGSTDGQARIRMVDTYCTGCEHFLILGSNSYVVLEPMGV